MLIHRFGMRVLVAGALVSLTSVSALAQEDASGLMFDGSVGMGITRGTYEYDRDSQPYDNTPVRPLHFEDRLTSPVVVLSAMPGYALNGTVAFGLLLDLAIAPRLGGRIAEGTIDSSISFGAAPALLLRTFGSLEAVLAAGVQRTVIYGGNNDIGSPFNVLEHEPASGPRVLLRVGQGGSFGWGVSASYAHLTGEYSTYRPITILAHARLSTW